MIMLLSSDGELDGWKLFRPRTGKDTSDIGHDRSISASLAIPFGRDPHAVGQKTGFRH